jgi:hypothetical protein
LKNHIVISDWAESWCRTRRRSPRTLRINVVAAKRVDLISSALPAFVPVTGDPVSTLCGSECIRRRLSVDVFLWLRDFRGSNSAAMLRSTASLVVLVSSNEVILVSPRAASANSQR